MSDAKAARAIVVCAVLTVAALAVREVLPQRSLELTDAGFQRYLMMPSDAAQVHRVRWVDEKQLHLLCNYREQDRTGYQPCGISLLTGRPGEPTQGLDLRNFSSITLDLSYHGSASFVRLGIRSFDPRFSRPDDGNSSRVHSIELRARDVAKPVTIGLSELTVPEWWITSYNLPREYNIPRLDNVVAIAIDVPDDLRGRPQELQLRRATLKGDWIARETLYLGALCIWVAGAVLAVLRRMSRMRAEQADLHRLARVDALTGVLNRRGLQQALEDRTTHKRTFSLLVLDLDHFKGINDARGHDAGDEVLRRTASLMAEGVRAGDIVGRWGGEEFVVACLDCSGSQAMLVAEKMRRLIEGFDFGTGMRMTASIGVASAGPAEDFMETFRRADAALYRAKSAGRNRSVLDAAPAEARLPGSG